MSRGEKIAIIRDFVPCLREQIGGLTPEQLTTQYNMPEWTIAQNIHHLVDSHAHAYLLFKLMLTEDKASIPAYNGSRFAELSDGSDANIEDSLLILQGLHARWTRMLENISDWEKEGRHPDFTARFDRDATFDDLLNLYSYHCGAHLEQIQDVLDKMPANT
jgi:DinB family protein